LARILDDLSNTHAADFASGFIAESPVKLRRLHQYFVALTAQTRSISETLRILPEFPPVRCNAPQFSAVFTPDGNIQPCFFISHQSSAISNQLDLNSPELLALRRDIRVRNRDECKTCVCSMYRGVRGMAFESLMP
jgi:MoaA/NifB/PqqE/SkfB family radical SAM enzyme